jgi:hypothetical protein
MGGLVGLGLWISVVCPVVLPPASAITVYLIGRIGDQTGSFWATLGLSVLGGFLAMLAFFVPDGIMFSPVLIPLGSSLGAVMGFNLTRRYKKGFSPEGTKVVLGRIAGALLLAGSLVTAIPSLGSLMVTFAEGMPEILKLTALRLAVGPLYNVPGGPGGLIALLVLGPISFGFARHLNGRLLLAANSVSLFGSIMIFVVVCGAGWNTLIILAALPGALFRLVILLPLTIIVAKRTGTSQKARLALALTIVLGAAADIGCYVVCLLF